MVKFCAPPRRLQAFAGARAASAPRQLKIGRAAARSRRRGIPWAHIPQSSRRRDRRAAPSAARARRPWPGGLQLTLTERLIVSPSRLSLTLLDPAFTARIRNGETQLTSET